MVHFGRLQRLPAIWDRHRICSTHFNLTQLLSFLHAPTTILTQLYIVRQRPLHCSNTVALRQLEARVSRHHQRMLHIKHPLH